jgi:hypothetical protein
LDITTPPTPNLLQHFASVATDAEDQSRLNLLATVSVVLLARYNSRHENSEKCGIGFYVSSSPSRSQFKILAQRLAVLIEVFAVFLSPFRQISESYLIISLAALQYRDLTPAYSHMIKVNA